MAQLAPRETAQHNSADAERSFRKRNLGLRLSFSQTIAWLGGNQRGGDNLANVAPLRNVPLKPKATAAGLVTYNNLTKQLLQLLERLPQFGEVCGGKGALKYPLTVTASREADGQFVHIEPNIHHPNGLLAVL